MSTTYEPSEPRPDSMIPLCVPCISGNEWNYVKQCIDTGWVSSVGAFVDRFEQMVADYVGVQHAIATVNGTSALQVALQVGGVEPNDEVLVSTLTFIASANAIRYAGAWPVFIDAEPHHWQMDPNLVEDFLQNGCEWRHGELRNRRTGRRVKAIEPVHLLGHPVELDSILALARKYELLVVEDAAESLGTQFKGRRVGGFGDLGCLSFNGNKLITTGGGGMILTNCEQLAAKCRYLTTQAKDDPTEYIHNEIGYNFRLPNLLAAFGCAQLEQIDSYIQSKRLNAANYQKRLNKIPGIDVYTPSADAFCTWWLYTVRVRESEFGVSSRETRDLLQRYNIQTRPLWQPLHLSLAHRESQVVTRGIAETLYAECLSLPSSVGNTSSQIDWVADSLRNIQRATAGDTSVRTCVV